MLGNQFFKKGRNGHNNDGVDFGPADDAKSMPEIELIKSNNNIKKPTWIYEHQCGAGTEEM